MNEDTRSEIEQLNKKIADLEKSLKRSIRDTERLRVQLNRERTISLSKINQQTVRTMAQREHDKYMRLLLSNTPNAILLFDINDRLVFCTDDFMRISKISNIDLISGRTLRELFQNIIAINQWSEDRFEEIAEAKRTKSSLSFNGYIPMDDGSLRTIEHHYAPMINEDGQYEGFLLIFHDITDIEHMRLEAEKASLAKSEFLSNMSHEIRTPLNAVIGMTNIGKDAQDIEKKDYCLDKVNEASTHLLGVINDILDMSKIEANKFELSLTDFNFINMVNKMINVISFKIEEKKQNLIVEIADDVPKRIICDEQRLGQVLANLFSNAVKFTPEEGTITLRVRFIEEVDEVCTLQLEVIDTGIGLSKEQQNKLFKSFVQADSSTSRQFGGTGLGLAITKNIIEMMDGEVWIDSELGKGASFGFLIRVRRGTESSDDDVSVTKTVYKKDCFAGYHVLLAEDVDINKEIVQSLLEPTGLTIDWAKNGKTTVEMYSANHEKYDAILMDVQMPEMDGYEATRIIRAMAEIPYAKSIPIIAMTANVFREDIENCIAAGMNDHLGKPIDLAEVVSKLNKYLPPRD